MEDTNTNSTSGTIDDNSPNQESPGSVPDIDLDALAEEILLLFKREFQIERERLGWY